MKTIEERWHDESDSSDESEETNSSSNDESSSSGTASSDDTPKKKKHGNVKRKDESDDEESDDDENDRNEKSENSDDESEESEESDDSDSDSEDEEQERKMKEKLKRLSRVRAKDSDDSSDDEDSDDESEENTSPKKTNDSSKTPLPPVEPNIKASSPGANVSDDDSSSDDGSDEEDKKKGDEEEEEKVGRNDKDSSEDSSDHSSSTEDSDSDSEHEKRKVNGITTDILHKLEQFSSEKHEKEVEKTRKTKTKKKKEAVVEDDEFDRMYANLKKQLAQFKTDLQNNLRKNITLQHDVKRMRYNVDAILEGKPLRAPIVVPPLNLSSTPDEQKTTPTTTSSSTPPDVKLAPFEQKKDFLKPPKKKSVSTGVDLKSVRILHGTWSGEEDLQADMKIEIDTTARKHATLTQYRSKETATYDIQTIQIDQLAMSRTVKDTYEVVSIAVTKKGTSGYTVVGRVKTRSSKRGDDSLKETDSFTVSSYEM